MPSLPTGRRVELDCRSAGKSQANYKFETPSPLLHFGFLNKITRALSVRLLRTGLVSAVKHVGRISLEFFVQFNVIRDKETLP